MKRCIVLDDDQVGFKYGVMFNDDPMVSKQDVNVEAGTSYGFDFIKLSVGRREMVLYRYMFSAQDYGFIHQTFQASDNG